VVPATGDIWFSDTLASTFRGALPSYAPAVIYSPASNSFVGVVSQLRNTSDLVFDPSNGLIYASDPTNNTVGAFNPASDTWVRSFPVGTDPVALALDPANNTLFVANAGSNNLTVINTHTQRVVPTTITTGATPESLAYSGANSAMFVACGGSMNLYEVNTVTYSISVFIRLAGNGGETAVSQSANTVTVTEPSQNALVVYNATNTAVVGASPPISGLLQVVTSPKGDYFVTEDPSSDLVYAVNTSNPAATLAPEIPVGSDPGALVPASTGDLVYAWSTTFRNVTPVNPRTLSANPSSPTLGARPVATSYDPASNRIFVADSLTSSLSVLNATTFAPVVSPISLPGKPSALADDPATSTIYVGLTGMIVSVNAATAKLNAATVTTMPGANSALAVDTTDGLLWDMNNASNLEAYHLGTLTSAFSTSVPAAPNGFEALTWDAASDQLFALTKVGTAAQVAVADAATGALVSPGIPSGTNLTALTYDPADGEVYVLGTNITMINATTFAVAPQSIYLPSHVMVGGSITYDPSREFVYATDSVGTGVVGQIAAINGASLMASFGVSGTVFVGFEPSALLAVGLPGATGAASDMIVVGNVNSGSLGILATSPPLITYFSAAPRLIDLGGSTQFSVQYVGGVGVTTLSYTGLPSGCVSANVSVLACTPTTIGSFTVVVAATDSLGNTVLASTPLTVDAGIVVTSTFSAPTFPQVDPGYSFTGTASATGGNPGYTFTWNFGDGTVASGTTGSHAYATAGDYVLTITATDSIGGQGSAFWSVVVNPSPTVTIVPAVGTADVNHSASFSASVVGGTGTGTTSWTFGGGSSASGSSAAHTWTRAGTYPVNATYTDALGVTGTDSVPYVVNPPLTSTFSQSAPSGSASVTGTVFTFSATPAGGSPPYSVVWSFGDGTQTTGLKVTHAYALAADYSVVATVTDAAGSVLNGTLSVNVGASGPSTSSSSTYTFPLGLFFGLIVGAALAAVIVYAVSSSRRRQRRPPPAPPPAVVAPYVPPERAEWEET
jgi:YVTN family beta-propeller protein